MAFNWQTFKTRALTAILFVVIMLVGLLWNKWSFLALFSIIHFGCWFEYQKLVGLIDKGYQSINPFHKYGVMIGGYGLMLFLTADWYLTETVSLHSIGWMLMLAGFLLVPVSELLFSKQFNFKYIAHSFFGLLYISLSWALLMHLRSGALWMPHNGEDTLANLSMLLAKVSGYAVPLMIIGSIWINDTMAYIVGSLIGKTPLSAISPKKTWEGTIGGIILSVAVMWGLGYLSQSSSAWLWAVVAAVAAVTGTVGDLLESKLKRLANVKDSGSFMPGHGGFLDRFDSLLLAVPFVWLLLKIFS
ncbi:phosphatidate cytidylyltransferase [Lacibacter cauensis]|uniref:Phosphatidate cytidylyltransferase n=1 Tax=Lacibacter cauensis TaxID=510947 RepID=A0A562SJX1_9BACT|nr:phosphatidate cytidylyltransferase [Lacibacter cauensis]TWI81502.1 phosphatidate cytidylyltransferase [Lacibacter cauensis]